MTSDASAGSQRAQRYVWWALCNLLVALVGTSVLLFCFVSDRDVRREIAQRRAQQGTCEQRVLVAAKPMLVDPDEVSPPEDRPKDGYFGKQGTEIRPAQLLSFEAIRSGRPASARPTAAAPALAAAPSPARRRRRRRHLRFHGVEDQS